MDREQIRRMQEGRRIRKEKHIELMKKERMDAISRLQARRRKAWELHGKLLGIAPFPKDEIEEWIEWWNEDNSHLPSFIGKLNWHIEYYMVMDYIAEPEQGLPVVEKVGWIKPFTLEEARAFIQEHEPYLRRLNGEELADYISRNNGDGGLRASV